MLKRLRWMALGALTGLGASVWARQRLQRYLDASRPGQVGRRVLRSGRELAGDLGDALNEGRSEMRRREAELRAQRLRPGVIEATARRAEESGRGQAWPGPPTRRGSGPG